MEAYNLKQPLSVFKLANNLIFQETHSKPLLMDKSRTGENDLIKKAILRRYSITTKTSRQKFQTRSKQQQEFFREMAASLKI